MSGNVATASSVPEAPILPSNEPTTPYPGLRPFLDEDTPFLFGRDRQIQDVVARLRDTQFVAILGGSGCGKSSLVRAGVVPELRSFGIRGAGDFWTAMVCTPGTQYLAAECTPSSTPVTRFVAKFERLLRPAPGGESESRRANIAAVLRHEEGAGFSRLVERYSCELELEAGLNWEDARFLFVIDQFEEIFHASNRDTEDARHLMECILHHFFRPHQRCYVVLTMRSEHLNDCARYLELPDAINRSSYLVPRLDEAQLEDVIAAPAQRFLRMQHRARRRNRDAALNTTVSFELGLVERLKEEITQLEHDPDHLPLLQHLLARLWESACDRELKTNGSSVPREITWGDLKRATCGPNVDYNSETRENLLRASLENWSEATYALHTPNERNSIDALLRNLAFKDPNTGMYSQERIDVGRVSAILREGTTSEHLKRLLTPTFIGASNYLHWDDEEESCVTLKVSHESFIRGWSRFRNLVDLEAERFKEFKQVLRRCADWQVRGRPARRLLAASELLRFKETKLDEVFANVSERTSWFLVLTLDRDGARLAKSQEHIDQFVHSSRSRQTWRQAGLIISSTMLLLVSALVTLSVLASDTLQQVVDRSVEFFELQDEISEATKRSSQLNKRAGLNTKELATIAGAAKTLESSREDVFDGLFSQWLFSNEENSKQRYIIDRAHAYSESRANGELRALLTRSVWRVSEHPPLEMSFAPLAAEPDEAIMLVSDDRRLVISSEGGQETISRKDVRRDVQSTMTSGDHHNRYYTVSYVDPSLRSRSVVHSVPYELHPTLFFDEQLNYMFVAASTVKIHALHWDTLPPTASPITTLTGVSTNAMEAHATKVSSWHELGGVGVSILGENWRVVAEEAQPLTDAQPQEWKALATAREKCKPLHDELNAPGEPRTDIYQDGSDCFAIRRATTGDGRPYERIWVTVYRVQGDGLRAVIANLAFGLAPTNAADWRIGKRGLYEGWIAQVDLERTTGAFRGAPWSTSALERLAQDILERSP